MQAILFRCNLGPGEFPRHATATEYQDAATQHRQLLMVAA